MSLVASALQPMLALGTLELLSPWPPGWGANLLRGLVNTLTIAVGAYTIGLVLGTLGASAKLYGGPVAKDIAEAYTTRRARTGADPAPLFRWHGSHQ